MALGLGGFSNKRKGPLVEAQYEGVCPSCGHEIMPGWLAGYVDGDFNCQECWEEVEDE